MKMRRIMAF